MAQTTGRVFVASTDMRFRFFLELETGHLIGALSDGSIFEVGAVTTQRIYKMLGKHKRQINKAASKGL